MKKKIIYLTAAIGIALFNCMPIMAETIISTDACIKPHYINEPQEKGCTLGQNIYTKEYLIGLILSGEIYMSENGFYINGIYYMPNYNNCTPIPKIKTNVTDILCD